MTDQETQKQPTPEELEQRRKQLIKFYNEELPLLKKQAEYEKLLTEIDMAKMTRLEIMITKAQIMQGPQDKQPENVEPKQSKKNKKA